MEKGHGRIDIRTCRTISDPETIAWLVPEGAWRGLRTIAMVEGERRINEPTTPHVRYYLSSLRGDAKTIADAVRSHWGIENQLHWVLDVALDEDTNRSRLGHSAENLAVIRKMALNLLRQEPTRKLGITGSRRKAGWDNSSLIRVLGVQ